MTSVLILLSGFDPGTYFVEDDGIANNGIAQLRGPDGNVIQFNIPTEFLTVTASAGRSVVFNLTESFGSADINVGSLTDASQNPDSIQIKTIAGAGDVLLASNGSITESGADAAPDVTASTLILSAATGVGTSSLALETQVGTLEAETTTGGINLNNLGNLVVGGLTDDVVGLDVETSGNLTLTNFGTITLNEESPGGFESVHGGNTSGNVTLTANGFDADIVSQVDRDAIAAPGGNITLTAGRDVAFGTLGLNFDNDVRARGNLTINAGRDLNVDGFADLASDGFGGATGGNVVVNAGRDINVLNATGTDGSIGAEGSGGGNTILNAGPGGFVRLLATSTSTLFSSTGDVRVNADRMVINATAGITASGGDVTIQPVTEGWNIDLGSVTDGAFALELSDAELDRIFTPRLNVGSSQSGRLDVTSAISPVSALDLLLRAGTDIGITGSITTGGALTLRAGDNIFQVAASAINAGGPFNAFVDEVGDDLGIGGVATANGTITASAVRFHGNADDDTLNGASGDDELNGNGGDDTLRGFAGADLLDGGSGADQMIGGLGDDEFVVDNAGDVVSEAVGEGTDTVRSSRTFTLGADLENLTLTGALDLSGIGNGLDNVITGNSGDNTLKGLVGADTMIGGLGDDTYVVDNAGDVVTEAGAGSDTVESRITYTLGANLEALTLTGGAAIDGTGNGAANVLAGNGAANTLNGAAGADTMSGGLGNDTYVVDNAGDLVTETGAGTDTVQSKVTFTLGGSLENLTLTGGAAIDGTGNGAANVLAGNGAANTLGGLGGNDTLDGGGGSDTLIGGLGNDTYVVDRATDVVTEAAGQGSDLVQSSATFTLAANLENLTLTGGEAIDGTGNTLDNVLTGNGAPNSLSGRSGDDQIVGGGGADNIFGGAGNDELSGGGGGDKFRFDTALGAATNVDDILDFSVPNDSILLDRDIFTGIAANGTLAASAFVEGTSAGDANDRILYDQATGNIFYDANGSAGGARTLFATVTAGTALTNADFVGYV